MTDLQRPLPCLEKRIGFGFDLVLGLKFEIWVSELIYILPFVWILFGF